MNNDLIELHYAVETLYRRLYHDADCLRTYLRQFWDSVSLFRCVDLTIWSSIYATVYLINSFIDHIIDIAGYICFLDQKIVDNLRNGIYSI